MIHFNALEFNVCRSEEVFLLMLSVYLLPFWGMVQTMSPRSSQNHGLWPKALALGAMHGLRLLWAHSLKPCLE